MQRCRNRIILHLWDNSITVVHTLKKSWQIIKQIRNKTGFKNKYLLLWSKIVYYKWNETVLIWNETISWVKIIIQQNLNEISKKSKYNLNWSLGSNFLFPISLPPDHIDLWYLNYELWNRAIVRKIKGLRHQVVLYVKIKVKLELEWSASLFSTGITILKLNNLRLRSFFEMEMSLWRRRHSFSLIYWLSLCISKSFNLFNPLSKLS